MKYQTFLQEAQKRREQMQAMRATGSTFTAIAKRFKVTPQRVQQILKKGLA